MKQNFFKNTKPFFFLLVFVIGSSINAKNYCVWGGCVPYKVNKNIGFIGAKNTTVKYEKFDINHDQKANNYTEDTINKMAECDKWYGRWPLNCQIENEDQFKIFSKDGKTYQPVSWTSYLLGYLNNLRALRNKSPYSCSIAFPSGQAVKPSPTKEAYVMADERQEFPCEKYFETLPFRGEKFNPRVLHEARLNTGNVNIRSPILNITYLYHPDLQRKDLGIPSPVK
jgi:hypothetical protein